MIQLLSNLWTMVKWLFTDFARIILNADLGPIGTLKDTWGYIVTAVAAIYAVIKWIRKRDYF